MAFEQLNEDLHVRIMSFVDEASDVRTARVSRAWWRSRAWICELPGIIRTASFSRDGSKIALCSEREILAVYDVATRRLLWRSEDLGANDPKVVWLLDGTIAVARAEPRVTIHDGATGAVLRELPCVPGERCHRLALTSDGTTLAVSRMFGVTLYDVATGSVAGLVTTPGSHSYTPVVSMSFAPDGQTLAVARYELNTQFYDVSSTDLRHEVDRTATRSYHGIVLYSLDGAMIAASAGGALEIYDAATFALRRETRIQYASILALAFSLDSKTIVVGASGGLDRFERATFYDVATLEVRQVIARSSFIIGVEISPEGKTCAIAGDSGRMYGQDRMGRAVLHIAATGERYRMRSEVSM